MIYFMKEIKRKCETKFCRTKARVGTKCDKCRSREWRAANPGPAAYHRKKWNAKVKGMTFTLTKEQFLNVWQPGLTIERNNPLKGYHVDNIKALSLSDNAAGGYFAAQARLDHTHDDNCPF